MAISSVGIGSGLDVESIVTQMIALEKQPIKTLEAKAEVISSKISTYGEIKSLTDDLNAAVRDLTLDRTWNTVKISSSSSSVANAAMTGSAAAGSYNIKVTSLAQAQTSVTTDKFDSSAKFASGKLIFKLGTEAALSPASNLSQDELDKLANSLKTFTVSVGNNESLLRVVEKINSNTDLSKHVVASVITDSSGKQQLMVRGRDTGSANAFTVAVEDAAAPSADQADLSKLAMSLADLSTAGQRAQDAVIKLNGVELVSANNTFADTIPGLSISVSAVGDSLLTLTQDKDAVKDSIQKFVDAYNALNDLLAASTKYNEESKVSGILQGDSSTVSLQNSLRMLTQTVVGNATGAFNRLSSAGIQMLQGGKLSVDSTKMATALNDMDALKSMFAAKEEGVELGGIAVRFKSFTDQLLAYEGTLNSKTDSLDEQLKRNKSEVEKVETRAETVEERLRKQYSALDVKMASLSSLSSYVEQMVTSWNKSKD